MNTNKFYSLGEATNDILLLRNFIQSVLQPLESVATNNLMDNQARKKFVLKNTVFVYREKQIYLIVESLTKTK
jgi:hypothetical protein